MRSISVFSFSKRTAWGKGKGTSPCPSATWKWTKCFVNQNFLSPSIVSTRICNLLQCQTGTPTDKDHSMAKSCIILQSRAKWKFLPHWKKKLIYRDGNFHGNGLLLIKCSKRNGFSGLEQNSDSKSMREAPKIASLFLNPHVQCISQLIFHTQAVLTQP